MSHAVRTLGPNQGGIMFHHSMGHNNDTIQISYETLHCRNSNNKSALVSYLHFLRHNITMPEV